MAAKFIRIRRIIIPILTMVILTSQVSGCAILNQDETLKFLQDSGSPNLVIEYPDYASDQMAQAQKDDSWIPLADLETYRANGFRSEFDLLFNINIVNNTKQGCLYTVNEDGVDKQSGNTTLRDAFRNKVFNTNYWSNDKVQNSIRDLVERVYTDTDGTSGYALTGSLNAYFNLLVDSKGDGNYKGGGYLTREQFYTLVYKAGFPVKDLLGNNESALGMILGDQATIYTPYANELMSYGYLSMDDGSAGLNGNMQKPITKFEAIYLLTNLYFGDKVTAVAGSELEKGVTAFGYRNAGNQIEDKEIQTDGTLTNNMLVWYGENNAKNGIDQSMMPQLIVAEQVGLAGGAAGSYQNSLFDGLTKDDAIKLLISTYGAENQAYGYLTTTEYGEMDWVGSMGNDEKAESGKTEQNIQTGIDVSGQGSGTVDGQAGAVTEREGQAEQTGQEGEQAPGQVEEPVKKEEPFTEVNETVYATGTVNLRSSYSTQSDKVGGMTKGQSVTRIGIGTGEADGWSKIQLSDGSIVYVSNKYISTTKPASSGGGGNTSKPATPPAPSKPSGETDKPLQSSGSGSSDQDSLDLIKKTEENRKGGGKVDTSKKDEHGNAIITDPDAV